ncbi:hypothetical protein KDA_28510 [Dictyobacter alpinus]|uniref:histidine kinase n=1 Tax=Dictyobacter alpinus TaxID=2014873 RepID=A0A402B7S1_9CHLR|nr:HAMP domain-containing sensor histidine kinase [Dictyobacter alpinus]GCE27367.1 hypothetical protein KDA_28510 [Dictyobacter alpinus]
MRAMCDIAIQSGTIWSCSESPQSPPSMRLIAPLLRPHGIVGLIICTTTCATGFGPGEHRLLYQQLTSLALQVEQALEYTCIQEATCPRTEAPFTSIETSAEHELDLSEQDAFFSMVSHDLRIPLSIIKGYIELLQVYGCTGKDELYAQQMSLESQASYLKNVMEQVQHMEILVEDLLDLSRLQAGQIKLRPAPLDLLALCQRVAQQMKDRVDQQATEQFVIRCIGPIELPPVWADEHRVRQILENLLENAIKYSPEGGLIEIIVSTLYPFTIDRRLQVEDNAGSLFQLSITIRDHGIGIPPWQQAHVFKPFQRLEQPATRQIAGHGLGLYIVRKLIETMHGSIILKSNEGQGTSVTLTLPIAVAAHPSIAQNQNQPDQTLKPTRLLSAANP